MKRAIPVLALLVTACIAPGNGKKGVGDAGPTGIAVVDANTTDNYSSASVSLLDDKGEKLAQDDCINSGATTPVLSTALSGDISFPSQPQPNGKVLIIDRTNSAIVTVDPSNCSATQDFSVGTGFYANPHDVVGISETKAYVTRYNANPTPGMQMYDGGNDILIIDPSVPKVTGRIDLSSYATTDGSATILSMPDRAVLANGKVYVSLAEQSADFMTLAPSRVVIIDPSTDTVSGTIDLPNNKSCSQFAYASSSKHLFLVCGGDFNADTATQANQSAVLDYDISGSTPTLAHSVSGNALGGLAINTSLIVPVNDQYAIAATYGGFSGPPPDALWNVDLTAGTATKLADAESGFVLGTGIFVPSTNRVLITDSYSTSPHVAVYDVSDPASPTALSPIVADPAHGLQPVYIEWY